jgi:transcriptional regulator of acetoin/glycerol metabolism
VVGGGAGRLAEGGIEMQAGFSQFRDALERARSDFLSGRDVPAGVREQIATSWRRSSLSGVAPDVPALPYDTDIDVEGRLAAAAFPVLNRLADRLEDTATAMLLADREARIIARWAGEPGLLATMDRTESAPGFSLREANVGTNGLGSVIEEKRALYVCGPEHFADRFVEYSCYGAPILHPVNGRVEGVLTLVCSVRDSSPLMMPFVQATSEVIEERLREAVGHRERVLLDTFSRWGSRSRRPVIVLNEQTIITNPAASRLLGGTDHAVLWESAAEAITTGRPAVTRVRLHSGRTIRVTTRPVSDGYLVVGAIVELDVADSTSASTVPIVSAGRNVAHDLQQQLGGGSRVWLHTLRSAAPMLAGNNPLLVIGAAGTGKLEFARAVHAVSGRRGAFEIIDAALLAVDGCAAWMGRVRTALREAGTVVLRRLEALDREAALALVGLFDSHPESPSARMIGLCTVEPGGIRPTGPHLDRLAVHVIELPELRDRADDIPELVSRRLTARDRAAVHFSAESLQALMRAPWPGNIGQLDRLVRSVAPGRKVGAITLDDLPAEIVEDVVNPLGQLEQLERRAIVHALRTANGNKKLASVELGISRSTLYRKMRAFGLDLQRTAF